MFRVSDLRCLLTLQVISASLYNQNANSGLHDIAREMSDFKTIITTKKNMYIDKTLFIKEVMSCQDKAILITRPPRFGKSLALSTLNYFFSDELEDSKQLFSGLDIMKAEPDLDKIRNAHMGKYPVINIDLSNVRGPNFNESFSAIQEVISREFLKHKYLVDNKKFLTDAYEAVLHKNADEERTANSINWLCGWINSLSNGTNHCIVLIDGYDTPVHTSFMKYYYDSMDRFMRAFLLRTLKKNTSLKKAVITGVLPLAGGVLPDDVVVKTVFDDMFSQAFGFTHDDVTKLTKRAKKCAEAEKKLLESIDVIYKGYNIGGSVVFNPRAVTQYLFEGRTGGSADQTSKALLETMLVEYGLYPVLTVQQLVAGESATKEVLKHQDFSNKENREKKYWGYMLHAGYLTVFSILEEKGDVLHVKLRVPNLEICAEIATALEEASKQFPVDIPSYTGLIHNLVEGNFISAQKPLENYVHYAGDFIQIDDKDVPNYVKQILHGVELRYNTKIVVSSEHVDVGRKYYCRDVTLKIKPKNDAGVSVRILLKWASVLKLGWYKLKKGFCPAVKILEKNQTEIYILYSVWGITSCLRPYPR